LRGRGGILASKQVLRRGEKRKVCVKWGDVVWSL